MTFIYHCESSHLRNIHHTSNYKCEKVQNSQATNLSNNGIAYDEQNELIFLSDIGERQIKIFKKDSNNKNNLVYLNKISTGFAGDNIIIKKDEEGNTILTVGIIANMMESIKFVMDSISLKKISPKKFPFGAIRIILNKDLNYSNENEIKNIKIEILVIQDEFKGVSSAYQIRNKVYLSSWCDDGIVVCKID